MHRITLLLLVLFSQLAHGQEYGAPRDSVIAELAGDGPAGPEGQSIAPPATMPLNEAYVQATPIPNVGQRVGQPEAQLDGTFVAPASENSTTGAPNSTSQPLRLSPRNDGGESSNDSQKSPPSISGTIINIVSSLAIVLGLFFLTVWFIRRGSRGVGGALPSDVVQVLGRSSLSPKQQLQLIRVGGKLILVAVSANGAQTLTEVTNTSEVERLATACEATRGGSASESFRQVLSQLGDQPAIGGFFGDSANASGSRTRRGSRREESRA